MANVDPVPSTNRFQRMPEVMPESRANLIAFGTTGKKIVAGQYGLTLPEDERMPYQQSAKPGLGAQVLLALMLWILPASALLWGAFSFVVITLAR